MSRKREGLSFKEKIEILKKVDENPKKKRVYLAKELGIASSTLHHCWAARRRVEECSAFRRERHTGEDIYTREAGRGPADMVLTQLPVSAWTSSEGKKVEQSAFSDWLSMLPALISDYAPRDVFNADEAGLFFNLQPERCLCVKGQACQGGQKCKRIALRLRVNADDSEKVQLTVIGRSKQPSVARSLQKHFTSFGEMESLQSGKVLPFSMEEATQMVRYLYHCAGVAMTLSERFPASRPKGVVLVLVEDARATCPVSAWRVGEVLAAGNSLLIVVKSDFCLAPMHFAEIAVSGGLPSGLLNVLIMPSEGIEELLETDGIGHVHVVASQSRCRELRRLMAEPLVSFSSYWGCGRAVAVVLEGADLHGAAAGIGQSFANSGGKGEACGVQVFVQECVYAKFIGLLRKELHRLRVGAPNNRTSDMSVVFPQGISTPPSPPKIAYTELPDAELLSAGQADKHHYPPRPALFADVAPSSPVVVDSVGWPLVLVTQFRTAKESVTLVNSALHHSEVSLWTEKLPVALELAAAYKATTVFVNGQGLRDASVEFGSRAGVACGERGLLTFIRPAESPAQLSRCKKNLDEFGAKVQDVPMGPFGNIEEGGELTTYKMFIGGQQTRPVSNASNPASSNDSRTVGYFPEAGPKDVRNAVEAALAGFKTWSSRSAHSRAQVLFYLAENLQMRAAEMASLIRNMTDRPETACKAEVDACVRRLFYWAAACDKDAGSVRASRRADPCASPSR
ncbi:hypothetical protein HPB49_011169 [Dermacentor silvarum]|uniref:Uncharacterized protein n=1 Tax=Dermacentor silvarum TaxID=543639 RepID=A0ACB8C361_DERSI|nr:hypothetical protein HPB49_011169 [Dermacentor silvarum]